MSDKTDKTDNSEQDLLQVSSVNEQDLLYQVSSGDQEAAEFLFESYKEDVSSFARRMLRVYSCYETGMEDDITQNTFIKVFKDIKNFKPNNSHSLRGWIVQIAKNEVRNTIRSKNVKMIEKIEPLDEENLTQLNKLIVSFKTMDNKINYEQIKEKLIEVVETLNSPFRETAKALIENDFENNMEEISLILECNEATVKTRLFRLRNLLSPILEPLKKWLK